MRRNLSDIFFVVLCSQIIFLRGTFNIYIFVYVVSLYESMIKYNSCSYRISTHSAMAMPSDLSKRQCSVCITDPFGEKVAELSKALIAFKPVV